MNDGYRRTTGKVRLAYEVSGPPDAPAMVLLHALGEGRTTWAPVMARFAEHFRVFAVDLRGHGDSDWPGRYSFQLMRDDVVDALGELGLRQVALVGHSMGGAVAYLVAMHRPDLVGCLVVEDAPPPYRRDRPVPARPEVQPQDFDWPVVPAIVSQVNEGDPVAWEGLGAIIAPTLVVGGGPDSHIPQDRLAAVAARIPSCELVTIPVGHHVHSARPEEFAELVLGWLRARPGRGA